MHITVTGSLGNIGKKLVTELVAAGQEVTVISSRSERTAAIEALGAKAAIGSITDADFLISVFSGSDAVFAMTPPNLGGDNVVSNTTKAGESFAAAFKAANVKKVVMLSSIGADLPNGNGPIEGLHNIEKIYNALEGVDVVFLRAGYFYINYYNDVPMVKNAGIIGANFPSTTVLPLVHPEDIAIAAATALQQPSSGKKIQYIISDLRPAADLATVFGAATGKTLPWIEFTDEQSLHGMQDAGVPAEIAQLYTDMGTGLRSGKIQSGFQNSGEAVTGKIKLETFAEEFAKAF